MKLKKFVVWEGMMSKFYDKMPQGEEGGLCKICGCITKDIYRNGTCVGWTFICDNCVNFVVIGYFAKKEINDKNNS